MTVLCSGYTATADDHIIDVNVCLHNTRNKARKTARQATQTAKTVFKWRKLLSRPATRDL